MRVRAVTTVAVASIAASLLLGCSPDDAAQAASVSVEGGRDAQVASADGSLVVELPGDSFTGSGRLSVHPTTSADGLEGWRIDLDGASLTGEATLRFSTPALAAGEPAPIVAYADADADGSAPVPVEGVTLDGNVATVSTTHFSSWFVLWWGDALQGARDLMDRLYSADATGRQPRCDGEAAIRAAGYSITSDDGARVLWCMGEGDGVPRLSVANGRGYAVAAESTPGLELRSADPNDLVGIISALVQEAPSVPQNSVSLISPGEKIEYSVTGSGESGVRVRPSVGGYLVSAGQFGIDTLAMIAPYVGKGSLGHGALIDALQIETCLAGYSGMVTSEVGTPADASRYLNDAIGTVLGCLGGAIERLGVGFVGVALAAGISWLVTGVRTALNGFGAAADIVLDPSGYLISISSPTRADPTTVARAHLEQNGVCSGCAVSGTLAYASDDGPGTLVTFGPVDDLTPTNEVAAVLVAADGSVPWWGYEEMTPGTETYEPYGQDAAGNIFIRYNPGRYFGYQVLVPGLGYGDTDVAAQVAEERGSAFTYAPAYAQAYYYAEVVDVDGDGTWEIRAHHNDCDPSCAEGTLSSEDLWFDGTRYAAR